MTDINNQLMRQRQLNLEEHAAEITEEEQRQIDQQYKTEHTGTIAHLKDKKKKSFWGKVGSAIGKSKDADEVEQQQAQTVRTSFTASHDDAFDNRSERVTIAKFNDLAIAIEKEEHLPYIDTAYREILESIRSYITSDNYDAQQANLTKTIDKLKKYTDLPDGGDDNKADLIRRAKSYKNYFEANTNGTLEVPAEHRPVPNPDTPFYAKWKDASKMSLFPHEPSVNDIKQRGTQDCYMLSSLSAIAYQRPELIRECMKDNGDGTVTVRFYDEPDCVVMHKEESLKSLAEKGDEVEFTEKVITDLFQSKRCKNAFVDRLEMDPKIDELELEVITSDLEILLSDLESNNPEWITEKARALLSNDLFKTLIQRLMEQALSDTDDETMFGDFFSNYFKNKTDDSVGDTVKATSTAEKTVSVAEYVTVTKEIATVAGTAELYATDSLWVQMIEKAYAAKFGNSDGKTGYEGISLGRAYQFLSRFTGQKLNGTEDITDVKPSEADIFPEEYSEASLAALNRIKDFLADGGVVTVGCDVNEETQAAKVKELNNTGIRNHHAYGLLNTFEHEGHHFVTLRDPYALFKREYQQTREGYKKTNASSIGLSANDTNGIFTMELNDFLATFDKITGRFK